ncbi:MAG: hypothetical protein ACC645_24865, partial [Pirellulales bacterium]
LPLLAIALAVMVFAWGSSTDTTEPATDGAALSISAAAAIPADCPTGKAPEVVCAGFGGKVTVTVAVDAYDVANGYAGIQAFLHYGTGGGNDLVFKGLSVNANIPDPPSTAMTGNILTTDFPLVGGVVGSALAGLIPPLPDIATKGDHLDFSFTCTTAASTHTITLQNVGDVPAAGNGSALINLDGSSNTAVTVGASIDVQCVPPPTATPTSTPPPIPKMSKCDAAVTTSCESTINHFLQRQGAKIPPADCLSGTPTALSEVLSQAIVSPNPKDPSAFQQIGAFEFEVHYDNKKVCVDLTSGDAWTPGSGTLGAPVTGEVICIVEDDVSKPQLEGVARMGCVTVGKTLTIDELQPLAAVDIYPQPEVYSQAKPNQDNGVVVQINNVNCDLGDEQGHAIPIFSCDDADITFRYLEGDVDPNCAIDAIDAQSIAFRWGVEKGSLIYKDFMNLEPSSQQADADIDINDLQFVYGRFGSTCEVPHPPQPPVNPKA